LTATAYNKSGHELSGVKIDFSLDNAQLASITDSATTGSDGTAIVTFTARNTAGEVKITASSGSITSTKTITILDQSAPASITLSANPSSIIAGKTATITAVVKDKSGNAVPNGTSIAFSMENALYGTVTSQSTTNAGTAAVTFSSANEVGSAKIIATSGSITESISITVSPVDAASIEFDSVDQNPVAIKATGGVEYSNIKFKVQDTNGNPATDINVHFTMSGPGGIGYLDENDSNPYESDVSTQDGIEKVVLHSGYEAGVVTIKAEVDIDGDGTYDLVAATPVISIGGGVASDKWFSVAVEKRNLAGWAYNNITTNITAYLADRFGNYNILNGQSVSFESEVGMAVFSNSVSADSKGLATVQARTQVSTNYGTPCEDVVPETWETNLKSDIKTRFDIAYPGHPRNGECSVLVFTKGEEHFIDGSNGGKIDGLYNTGETYTDLFVDAFRDYDDDGLFDDGSSSTPGTTDAGQNPAEDCVDVANNNVWDGKNGQWDGDINIFRNTKFLVTGTPHIIAYIEDQTGDGNNESSFVVENGTDLNGDGDSTDTSAKIHVLVCDDNYNPPPAGSVLSVSVDNGKLIGGTTMTYPDLGPIDLKAQTGTDAEKQAEAEKQAKDNIEFTFTIVDDDPSTQKLKPSEFKIQLTWEPGGGYPTSTISKSLSGTVE